MTQALFGHQEILQDLLSKQQRGALHHSLIFYGSEGVGKETLCHALIEKILSAAAETPEQRLRTEAQLQAKSHPHVLKIEPVYDDKKQRQKQDITLDSLKRLDNFLRLAPTEPGPRFVIVKPADGMNINTQNAILKILEEPPRDTYFFLLAASRHMLLPTIRSRTVEIPVKSLPPAIFRQALQQLMPAADGDRIDAYYALTHGVVGQALQMEQDEVLDYYADGCRAIVNLLERDSTGAMSFSEGFAGHDGDDILDALIALWRERIAEQLKATLRGTSLSPLVPEEGQLLLLWQNLPQHKLLEMEQQIGDIWQRTRHAHLDRKLAVLSILRLLADSHAAVE